MSFCSECGLPFGKGDGSEHKTCRCWVYRCKKRRDRKQRSCANHSIRGEQLLKNLSNTLGSPWHSVEGFDSDALVNTVERVIIKPDGVDVVMKYRQAANG